MLAPRVYDAVTPNRPNYASRLLTSCTKERMMSVHPETRAGLKRPGGNRPPLPRGHGAEAGPGKGDAAPTSRRKLKIPHVLRSFAECDRWDRWFLEVDANPTKC